MGIGREGRGKATGSHAIDLRPGAFLSVVCGYGGGDGVACFGGHRVQGVIAFWGEYRRLVYRMPEIISQKSERPPLFIYGHVVGVSEAIVSESLYSRYFMQVKMG